MFINWTNRYGCKWANGGLITVDLAGAMYFNLYSNCYYFQNNGFTNVTISTTGLGIGCTSTYPLHVSTHVTSTEAYKFLVFVAQVLI